MFNSLKENLILIFGSNLSFYASPSKLKKTNIGIFRSRNFVNSVLKVRQSLKLRKIQKDI